MSLCLSVSLSPSPSHCLTVSISVSLSLCRSISLSVCLSVSVYLLFSDTHKDTSILSNSSPPSPHTQTHTNSDSLYPSFLHLSFHIRSFFSLLCIFMSLKSSCARIIYIFLSYSHILSNVYTITPLAPSLSLTTFFLFSLHLLIF